RPESVTASQPGSSPTCTAGVLVSVPSGQARPRKDSAAAGETVVLRRPVTSLTHRTGTSYRYPVRLALRSLTGGHQSAASRLQSPRGRSALVEVTQNGGARTSLRPIPRLTTGGGERGWKAECA